MDGYSTNPTKGYQIDPAFNKDLVFAYQAYPEIDISKLTSLNKNWLSELEAIIFEADPNIQEEKIFDRHVGEESTYRAKDHLIKQLQLICHRLQGNLDSTLGELFSDKRKALIIKLTEEVKSCSEGFHNRLNIIVDLFYKPRNLAELLCVVRKEIVEQVATEFTNEIHAWNRVTFIAASDGLGVKANLSKDRYPGNLPDLSIRRALQKSFHEQFTPFRLPILLIEAFMKFIPELETEKKNKDGLNQEMQEKITTLIQHFLPEFINETPNDPNYWGNYFEILQDEKNSLDIIVVNINFEKLYESFFKALSSHRYFKSKPQANTLIDSACQSLFLKNKRNNIPDQLISKLFKEEKYSDLLDQLKDLNIQFPNYYQTISKLNIFNKNCQVFLNYLTKELNINKLYLSKIVLGFQLIINLDLCRKHSLIQNVAATLLSKDQSDFNLLMFAAQHKPDLVKDTLAFFKKNQEIISRELVKEIFLMKNKDHLNAIMIAAIHHPELLETMLDFVGENIKSFGTHLEDIFLENNSHYNLLILATSREAIDAIVFFFNNYIYSVTKKIFFTLFMQRQKNTDDTALRLTVHNHPDYLNNILESIINYLKTDGKILNSTGACTILMLAAEKQAKATFSILDFISENIEKFDKSHLEKIFLEKNKDGLTILMLAARYQPNALEFILRFIDKHHNLFHEEDLPKLFLEKNRENYNCLMLAAKFQPSSIPTILNFITRKLNFFIEDILKILFEENEKNYNSLVLARRHPDAIEAILKFMTINQKFVNGLIKATVEQILLKKHESGFTLLMYTARDQAKSLDFILKFIEKNEEQFSEETLRNFIIEKNTLEYNALMLAARNEPDAVKSILDFIAKRIHIFPVPIVECLFLEETQEGISTLMVAAQYQPEALKIILDFIQNRFSILPLDNFLRKFLTAQNRYRVNALMLAATYQPEAVELLLTFVSNKIAYLDINTLQQFIFKKIHDKEAASAVFFGGGYDFRKTVMSVTSQLKDPTATNALLRFVDKHIEVLGMQIFTNLLTEQDKDKNYIFNPACSRHPYIMKKTLNFIATSPHCEALKLVPHLLTDFIFGQLARWPIENEEDENLFGEIISNCSNLLLNHFNIDRFGEHFNNLEAVSEKLFPYLLGELELKKRKIENQFLFFRWFSSAEQEFQVGQHLRHIVNNAYPNKLFDIERLQGEYPKFLKSKSALSALYEAFITIEEKRNAEKMHESHHKNDATHPQQQLTCASL